MKLKTNIYFRIYSSLVKKVESKTIEIFFSFSMQNFLFFSKYPKSFFIVYSKTTIFFRKTKMN